jgi:hypothetical protein
MTRTTILMAFFFSGTFLFSQTWTIKYNENFDLEWKMVTREEWHLLLTQKEAQYEYAILEFHDVIEMSDTGPIRQTSPVIRGFRPPLQGYYYTMGTFLPRTEAGRISQNMIGGITVLRYGNSETGRFSIYFYNRSAYNYINNLYYIGSDLYNRRYNQCIRWVNRE